MWHEMLIREVRRGDALWMVMVRCGSGIASAWSNGRHDRGKLRGFVELTQDAMACRWIGKVNHFPGTDLDLVTVVFSDHARIVLVRTEALSRDG